MAGRISAATIDQVNEKTDIVELVGEYTRLEKKGVNWWGCCPFHNEKTPSFNVQPDKHMCYCFGCGKGGGVINFFMEMEKVTFVEAVKALAKRSGVEIIYDGGNNLNNDEKKDNIKELVIELYTRVAGTYSYLLTSSELGKNALAYTRERGITDETIRKFQLGYSPSNRKWLKKFLMSKNYTSEFLGQTGLFSKKYEDVSFFSNRLMFPICDRNGKVVAFGGRVLEGDGPKYMNSGDMIQYKKGETLYAFNLARQTIREKKAVIFCEGYMDVIAYHQCGIKNAVAPLGTALTEDQVKLVKPFVDTVLLSFDSDGAGQKATYKAILLCRKAGVSVKIIQLGQGKDPAEIMKAFGGETLTNDVNAAIIDSDFLLSVLKKEYNTETPEGKTQAALDFFPYIDALQSDIQKESCIELLCQTFNLKPEAVKKDFNNREDARKNLQYIKNTKTVDNAVNIRLNAELRAVLAVIANIDYFPLMRSKLSADDFEDLLAKNMFIALEECFRDDAVSYESIILHCNADENLQKIITRAITSGEFTSTSPDVSKKAVDDSIQLIRRNSLERKRERIMNKIRQMKVVTLEDEKQMEILLSEKVNIDQELNPKKDANE